jgi:hypothetical protein
MRIAYTSRRPFSDGPVHQPFLENDPANIAYALDGEYFSFYTLKKLSGRQLEEKLKPYTLVFVALDLRALDIVERIADACDGRLATYSEGSIADYQMQPPAGQYTFLRLLRQAAINFLYWEKYVPFYRSLTGAPVAYLPYPYLTEKVRQYYVPPERRPGHVTLPSGLSGATRNGLSSLSVAKKLLEENLINQINCWLSTPTFSEDAPVVHYFLDTRMEATPAIRQRAGRVRFNWRQWLHESRLDYRSLLRLKNRLPGRRPGVPAAAWAQTSNLTLYRRQTWLNYAAQTAHSTIVIDMNNRETVGRNALDCAALGIACVSTSRSDIQPRLFPQTTVEDSWDVDQALAFCRRLLQDKAFYQSVADQAAAGLKHFETLAFQRRFQAILECYPDLCK